MPENATPVVGESVLVLDEAGDWVESTITEVHDEDPEGTWAVDVEDTDETIKIKWSVEDDMWCEDAEGNEPEED